MGLVYNKSNMQDKIKLVMKKGTELTTNELFQIKEAIFREFKVLFNSTSDQSKDKSFFLLKKGDFIFAMGALWKVQPVIFNGENFIMYGVLNVVANIKGKGYGKQVVSTMRKYLTSKNFTGFGFCMLKNRGFYEKCGFNINTTSTQRFVYKKGNERITNQDGQIIFHQDSSDGFMKKVLSRSEKEVSIPTQNLW